MAPNEGECVSIDNITDAFICEQAGTQISSLTGSYGGEVQSDSRPFGCFYV
jgi:hypothetical protein